MKFVIGSGACGFQRIHHILNRLGQGNSYKIIPRKMQNSFEIEHGAFINERLSNPNDIKIGAFYLKQLESLLKNDSNTKVLCLKGDKCKTI